MRTYEIKKILSNNVVLVTGDHKDFILIGSGIGFGKKKGQMIEHSSVIEESFISLEHLNKKEQKTLIEEVDSALFEIIQEIVKRASKKLGEKLNPKIHLGLIDHINYAINRINEGIEIVNPFLNETKIMYPEEFAIAEQAVEILSKHYNIDIPEAEIGFITLHIYGAREQHSRSEALQHAKLIKDITAFVEDRLKINITENPFNYSRFVIHLKALLIRVINQETIQIHLGETILESITLEYSLAKTIGRIIENALKIEVPENEIGFIAIHLHRINQIK